MAKLTSEEQVFLDRYQAQTYHRFRDLERYVALIKKQAKEAS
ncbi:hypothetical protein [Streptococcus oricebi]|nr:hypothetical protein [Streptococcus oricebi]